MNSKPESERYFAASQQMWDDWATVHMRGNAMYPVRAFLTGEAGVAPNIPDDIGSVDGKSMLHLMCHFGMDSLMWARQGARVTGVDFSAKAIAGARALNEQLHLDAHFIQANVFDLPEVLDEQFDIVITYFGILHWLPDLTRWSEIVAHFLKPGGIFYIADDHPFKYMIEGGAPDPPHPFLAYTYFPDGVWVSESGTSTYADDDAGLENRTNYQWRHRLRDLVTAISGAGLDIGYVHEFPFTFCDIFDYPEGGITGRMERDEEGWYWHLFQGRRNVFLPPIFSLKATKGTA